MTSQLQSARCLNTSSSSDYVSAAEENEACEDEPTVIPETPQQPSKWKGGRLKEKTNTHGRDIEPKKCRVNGKIKSEAGDGVPCPLTAVMSESSSITAAEGYSTGVRKHWFQDNRATSSRFKLKRAKNRVVRSSDSDSDVNNAKCQKPPTPPSKPKINCAKPSLSILSSDSEGADEPGPSSARQRTTHSSKLVCISTSSSDNDSDVILESDQDSESVPRSPVHRVKICSPKWKMRKREILGSSDESDDNDDVPLSRRTPEGRRGESDDNDDVPLSQRTSEGKRDEIDDNMPLSQRLLLKRSMLTGKRKATTQSRESLPAVPNGISIGSSGIDSDRSMAALDAQSEQLRPKTAKSGLSGSPQFKRIVHSMSDSDEELPHVQFASSRPVPSGSCEQSDVTGVLQSEHAVSDTNVTDDEVDIETPCILDKELRKASESAGTSNSGEDTSDPWLKFLRGCRQDRAADVSTTGSASSSSVTVNPESSSNSSDSWLGTQRRSASSSQKSTMQLTESTSIASASVSDSCPSTSSSCSHPATTSTLPGASASFDLPLPTLKYRRSPARKKIRPSDRPYKNLLESELLDLTDEECAPSRSHALSSTYVSKRSGRSDNIILLSDTDDDSSDIDEETWERAIRDLTSPADRSAARQLPSSVGVHRVNDRLRPSDARIASSALADSESLSRTTSDDSRSMWDIFGRSSRPSPKRKRIRPLDSDSVEDTDGSSDPPTSCPTSTAEGKGGYVQPGKTFYGSRRRGPTTRAPPASTAASSSSAFTVSSSLRERSLRIDPGDGPTALRAKSSRILQNKSRRKLNSNNGSQGESAATASAASSEAVEIVQQLDADEAFARQLQEEMDREFAASLQSRTTPSPPVPSCGGAMRDPASSAMWNPVPHDDGGGAHTSSLLAQMRIPVPDWRPTVLGGSDPLREDQSSQPTVNPRGRTARPPRRRVTRASAAVSPRRPARASGLEAELAMLQSELDMVMAIGAMSDDEWGNHLQQMRTFVMPRGRARTAATRRGRRARAISHLDETFGDGDSYEELLALSEMLGNVVGESGLSKEQISRLPTEVYRQRAESEPFECHVCMCEAESGDKLRILPCLHKFHSACIDKWIKDHPTCPVCREKVEC